MSKKLLLAACAFLGLTACQSSTPTSSSDLVITGTWHIESVQGRPVIDYSPAQLTFGDNNQLSGNNSCNQFFGEYQLTGNQLIFYPRGNSMKACVDALMEQEQRVKKTMPQVTHAKLEKGLLLLTNSEGETLFVLSQM